MKELTGILKGGASTFEVEVHPHALVIKGDVPLDAFDGIKAMATARGFDLMDFGVASATGATFVLTNRAGSAALRAEIDKAHEGENPEERWLYGYDTGLSSLTIFRIMTGRRVAWRGKDLFFYEPQHPHDPDDFGRCYRLLKLFPSWRRDIGKMAKLSDEWAALVVVWDELESLYEQELPTGSCPRLWARMKETLE